MKKTPDIVTHLCVTGLCLVPLIAGSSNHDRTASKAPFPNLEIAGKHFGGDNHPEMTTYQTPSTAGNSSPHSASVKDLKFLSRQQKLYSIKFVARPDAKRFQLIRLPSAAWPRRQTFLPRVGDTTTDGQLKIEKFIEKPVINQAIFIRGSELHVTFTETGKKVILVRNVVEQIPIYFAEIESAIGLDGTQYVKEGDTFTVGFSSTEWTLKEVKEKSCIISRKTDDGKVITKELKKSD